MREWKGRESIINQINIHHKLGVEKLLLFGGCDLASCIHIPGRLPLDLGLQEEMQWKGREGKAEVA